MTLGRLCPSCGELVYEPCCQLAGKTRTRRRELARKVWDSPRFKRLRLLAFKRDGWRCVDCGAVLGSRHVGEVPIADHEIPFEDEHDPLAWDLDNIRTRCVECAGRKDAPRASTHRR